MVADDDDDVPGRLLRPLFIAMGNFLEKVGTAMAPTGRHTERYAFFIAFSTRLINESVHILYVRHIENPPESLSSSQTQDGFDSLVCTRCHTQGTLLAQGGTVRTTTVIKNHLFQRELYNLEYFLFSYFSSLGPLKDAYSLFSCQFSLCSINFSSSTVTCSLPTTPLIRIGFIGPLLAGRLCGSSNRTHV